MICCNKEMVPVLDFKLFAPSPYCEICFGSGNFYLGDGEVDSSGCDCIKGFGVKKMFLECRVCHLRDN